VTAHAIVTIYEYIHIPRLGLSTHTRIDKTWGNCCLNLGRSPTFRTPLSPSSWNDVHATLLQMTTHIHNRSTATCRHDIAKRFTVARLSLLSNIELNGPHPYMLFSPTPFKNHWFSLKGGPPWCVYPVQDSSMNETKRFPKRWTSSLYGTGNQTCSNLTYSFHFFQDLPGPQCPFDSQSAV
jgi:hypothetical protein